MLDLLSPRPGAFRAHRRSGCWALAVALFVLAFTVPSTAAAQTFDITLTSQATQVVEGDTVFVDVVGADCFQPQNDVLYSVTVENISTQTGDVGPPTPTTIALGESGFSASLQVPTIDDVEVEPTESFRIRVTPLPGQILSCVEPGSLIPTEGTVEITLLDNDVFSGTLSIGDANVLEGDSGTTAANFSVVLTPAAQGTVTVDFATANGSASGADDYQPRQGTLSFAPGQTTQVVTVQVNGDLFIEPDETFFVDLSNPDGADLGDARGDGTIRNDDSLPPDLSISDVSLDEGDDGSRDASFVLTLSQTSLDTVQVDFATADGSAQAGSDYQVTQGQVTFPPGLVRFTVRVPVSGDTEVEPDETFFVDLSNPRGARLADGRGEATIRNDDEAAPPPPPTPGLSIGDAAVAEGDAGSTEATFAVTLTPAGTSEVTVSYATADGSAQAGSDYEPAQGTLRFAPGETAKTVTVAVRGDSQVEPDETFFVDLSSPDGASLADARGEGTIRNDDANAPPPPNVSIGDSAVAEGDSGTRGIRVVVSLSAPASGPVTVSYATANGSAVAGSDYGSAQGTLTIPAGQTQARITVGILGDTAPEAAENFFVDLTAASVPIADGRGQVVIRNDDDNAPPTFSVEPVGDAERTAAPGQRVTLQVRVGGAAKRAGVPVTWQVEGDAVLVGGATSLSQADGIAGKVVEIGSSTGTVAVTAQVPGPASVVFQIRVQPVFSSLFQGGETAAGRVAGALDEACATASGEFGELCDYLGGLDDPQTRREAVEALVPDHVSAMATVAGGSIATQNRQVLDRLKRRRTVAAGEALDVRLAILGLDPRRVRNAYRASQAQAQRVDKGLEAALEAAPRLSTAATSPATYAQPATELADDASRWGLFFSGSITDGNRETTARELGFDFETEGLTAGVDYALDDRLSVGVALGLLSTRTDFTASGGSLDVDGISLSAFAGYAGNRFYLDAVATYGRNDYDLARAVDLPTPFQGQSRFVATGDPDGDQLGLALAAGRVLSLGGATVDLFGRASYLESSIDRYRERGARALSLEIEEQEIESLILEAGVDFSWAISVSWGVLQPQLRAAYLRELEDDSRLLRARFVADRSFTEFLIPTDAPDRDFFNTGLGLSAIFPRGWSAYLFYETDLSRDDLDTQALSAGLRVEL